MMTETSTSGRRPSSVTVMRPERWDTPFGAEMTDEIVRRLLELPEFAAVRGGNFPAHVPLAGILKNDARIMRYQPAEIIVRDGDYGSSAFLVLKGTLRVILPPGLSTEMLGRRSTQKKSFFKTLSQLWRNRAFPEVRSTRLPMKRGLTLRNANADKKATDGWEHAADRVFLQDVPVILDSNRTAVLEKGSLFGELAALGRVPRTATVFAQTDVILLEIRWQGLRELRKFDPGWRRRIDESYRANALAAHLRATPFFAGLDGIALNEIARHTLFETYGSFDWHLSYKQLLGSGLAGLSQEPIIARQGDYPDGLLLIRAGFARVSSTLGAGERTLTYLGAGDAYGLEEISDAWQTKTTVSLRTSLTAVGYVDVLRVPTHILEKHVLPKLTAPAKRLSDAVQRPLSSDGLIEWAIEKRFMNGTQAMLIDLDRCTRCDDCVRACASTHDGNPRFVRHGKTFDHWMVANACMHCADPVCMIGCPTGAIHRLQEGGVVVINDDTCIGCGTCANSCPYDNILMVGINDAAGKAMLDPDEKKPILAATKCDLCSQELAGPACVRACPHDALTRMDFRMLSLSQKGAA